jgi:hypothetical protein
VRLAQVVERFPNVIGLFTSKAGFYRVLHYQIAVSRRATLGRHRDAGTGEPVDYTVEHLRIVAVRRLINVGLGCKISDNADEAILRGTWDVDTMTVTVVMSGAVAITVLVPDGLWAEIAPGGMWRRFAEVTS